MTVKMTQNLENTMETHTSTPDTWIEKMEEMFSEDLGEIRNSQAVMSNAITEMKNTLEGTNSRVTEADDRISEVEDGMVEINESERKKEKN